MEYIIERNSSTPGFKADQDAKVEAINEYVKYHVNEEGFKLHSVVPMNSGDHLVIMEPDNTTDYTVYYRDIATNRMILEFETNDMLEQLKLLKETDSIAIESPEGFYEGSYVKSSIHLIDDGTIISEILNVYLSIEKVE